MRTSYALVFVLFAALGFGCDKGGVHPLGQVRDQLAVCVGPTETWLRSTDTGTEVFIIGEVDPSATEPPCFLRGFVEQSSTTTLATGTYVFDEALGTGTFSNTADFIFRYQPEVNIVSRRGSQRTLNEPPLTVPFSMERDGEQLLLTIQGDTLRLTSIGDVIDALDETTMAGAEDVFRLFNLSLFTSQARLLGFGGTGMTQYLDVTAEFGAAIANGFTVRVENILNPDTDITYLEYMEFTGITIDGLQRTMVDLNGDGDMEGALTFRFEGRTRTIEGTLSYLDLKIRDGVAGAGTYTLSIEGGESFVLPYTLAAQIDLRGTLPEAP